MTIYENSRLFLLASCTVSFGTVNLLSKKIRDQVKMKIVFRGVIYMDTSMVYDSLTITTVTDEDELRIMKAKIERYGAATQGYRGRDSSQMQPYLEDYILSKPVQFYKLTSRTFTGFMCCSYFDVFENDVKVLTDKPWGE